MNGYINKFDENKITMSLMVKDKQLLKNYNKIWKKIERLLILTAKLLMVMVMINI